jgi:hypothetical protein
MKMTDVITSITKKEFPPNQLFIILEVRFLALPPSTAPLENSLSSLSLLPHAMHINTRHAALMHSLGDCKHTGYRRGGRVAIRALPLPSINLWKFDGLARLLRRSIASILEYQ